MAFSAVPVEVMESIVNLLATEDDALFSSIKSCSLVSHSLLPYARRHIFKLVILKRVTDSRTIVTYTTPRFVRLISSSPEIAPYVRTLEYAVAEQDEYIEGLAATLGSLTSLRSLELTGPMSDFDMLWVEFPCLETILKLMHLPTLSNLKLRAIESFPLSSLALCNSLKFLEMEFLLGLRVGDVKLCEQVPCLESLAVSVISDKEFLGKLCTTCADGRPIIDISSLQKLSVNIGYTDMQPESTLQFFKSCIQLVDFKLVGCHLLFPGISFVDLLRPSIQTLQHIHIEFDLFGTNFDPLTPSVASQIASLAGSNIFESFKVSVVIWLPRDHKFYIDNYEGLWSPLDNVFTQSQFGWPKLQKVSLNIKLEVMLRYWATRDCTAFVQELLELPGSQFAGLRESDNIIFDFNVAVDPRQSRRPKLK